MRINKSPQKILSSIFTIVVLMFMLSAHSYAAMQSLTPKRVVVLEFSLLDEVLALGIKPIGIASNETQEGSNPEYLISQIKGITSVGTRQQPNLERILALKPDLIIADDNFQLPIANKLKEIAPTIMMNGNLGQPQQQMKNVLALGKIFNKETKAKQLVAQFEKIYHQAKKIGQAHPATVMAGFAQPNGIFMALTQNATTTGIFHALGKENLVKQYSANQVVPVTVEKMLAENPDIIVLLVTNTENGKEIAEHFTHNPLWPELKAVKNHHVYIMSRNLWAIDHGIEAMTLMLNQAKQSGFLQMRAHPLMIQ